MAYCNICNGAELESTDKEHGRTPLLSEAENGHELVVKLLLDNKAHVGAALLRHAVMVAVENETRFLGSAVTMKHPLPRLRNVFDNNVQAQDCLFCRDESLRFPLSLLVHLRHPPSTPFVFETV
jgi:ankyrin repeat protein